MMDLYADEILDHYKHPRHFGHLDEPTLTFHDTNPLCGDEITLELRIEDNKVADVAFTGHGCAISRAAASMMSEEIVGMSLDELKKWDKSDILDLLGIEVGPVRIKCALLPLKALKAAVWGLADDDSEN
jgi:nitrogen fixation protein NifU and related proteins